MFKELAIAEGAFEVTPGAALPNNALALYVGGTGDVEVTTLKGQTVTFTAVPAGQWVPVVCSEVTSNTTATDVVGVY